jgi:hypothetical protein
MVRRPASPELWRARDSAPAGRVMSVGCSLPPAACERAQADDATSRWMTRIATPSPMQREPETILLLLDPTSSSAVI